MQIKKWNNSEMPSYEVMSAHNNDKTTIVCKSNFQFLCTLKSVCDAGDGISSYQTISTIADQVFLLCMDVQNLQQGEKTEQYIPIHGLCLNPSNMLINDLIVH